MQITTISNGHPRRMRFLPEHFGARMMQVETRVYAYADKALAGYRGGLWDFAETGNGAGFMVPPAGGHRTIPGGYEFRESDVTCNGGDVSREAAGLALTTLAVNHELWKVSERPELEALQRKLQAEWEKLMDACAEHPESSTLFSILD